MASGAQVAAAGSGGAVAGAGGGGNPFQVVTNLYAEKNNQGSFQGSLGAATQSFGGPVNAGNFLRAVRLLIRTVTAGTGGTIAADGVFNAIQSLVLTNVDGSEILYNMSGYAHSLCSKYFRPFDQDPYLAYDYSAVGNSPSGTLVLKPEIRWTAGALANTDSRSQYRFDGNVNTEAAFGTGFTLAPVISITPYMDAYAQPDSADLQGTPNQPVPPGVNLQVKRRHQIFSGLSGAGGDNTLLSSLVGNALRGQILIARDGNGVRQDALSSPVQYRQDNRSLGKLAPDVIFQWMEDFYNDFVISNRETGVYVFPRFLKPGQLTGQGWQYTSNATKLQWEYATATGITGTPSVELVTDEVYPVGPVDPSLVDI